MAEDKDIYSYLPEREPKAEDYKEFDWIEVVHFPVDAEPTNERERIVQSRLQTLRESGIEIREVDIDTDDGDIKGKNIAVAGSLGDVCAPKRRRFILDHGGNAKIDTSLTSDY